MPSHYECFAVQNVERFTWCGCVGVVVQTKLDVELRGRVDCSRGVIFPGPRDIIDDFEVAMRLF